MKTSRYNWSVNVDGKCVLYNGFTGAIIELDDNHLHLANILTDSEIAIDIDQFSQDESDLLKHSGMLIEDSFDERFYLETCMNELRFGKAMKLTAVMTRQCNFSCVYCSQSECEENKAVLGDVVIHKLELLLNELKPTNVHTTLYGGEPLLYPDNCLNLITMIRKIYPDSVSMLVTNGYLLTGQLAKTLSESGVQAAQITVDGPESIHDSRRMLRNRKGTFRKIIENIQAASEHMKIVIRVNRDASVHYDYSEFRRMLIFNDNIYPYRAPTSYDHVDDPDRRGRNLSAIQNELCPDELYVNKLNARFPGCAANTLFNAVILPEGKLARCWNQVQDPTECVEISRLGMISSFKKWSSWSPFDESIACYNCKMLPTCGGGCSDKYLKKRIPQCRYSIDSYKNFIKYNYIHRATGQTRDQERRGNGND